jgi:hypothetical protein
MAEALVPAVEPLAGALTGPLASVTAADPLAAAEDDVADLLGTDPAAGVATLVSLVTITDVVDLRQAGSPEGELVQSPADSMLNALAADAEGETAPADVKESPASDLVSIPDPAEDDLGLGLG